MNATTRGGRWPIDKSANFQLRRSRLPEPANLPQAGHVYTVHRKGAKEALKKKLVPNVIFLVAMWKRKLVLKMSWSFNMLNYFDNWKLWQAAPNSLSYVRCHLNSYQKCDFMFSRQCVMHGVWADVLVVGRGEEMHPIWILNPDMPVSPHLIMWRNTWYGKSVTTVFKFHMYHEQLLPHGNHTFFLSVLLPNFDLIPWSW